MRNAAAVCGGYLACLEGVLPQVSDRCVFYLNCDNFAVLELGKAVRAQIFTPKFSSIWPLMATVCAV